MSQENVEIVRRVFEELDAGLERGNVSGAFDAGLIAPDYEWIIPPGTPLSGTYQGREGWEAFMRVWTENFEDWSARVDRFIDAGDDRVLVIVRQTAVGRGSGAPVEWSQGQIYELEGGRVIRVRNYLDPAQAFEAAGLSE